MRLYFSNGSVRKKDEARNDEELPKTSRDAEARLGVVRARALSKLIQDIFRRG